MLKFITMLAIMQYAPSVSGAKIHITGPDERKIEFGDGTTVFATLSGGGGFLNSTVPLYAPDFVTQTGVSVDALGRRLMATGSSTTDQVMPALASVACGNYFTCVLAQNDSGTNSSYVQCWGRNVDGELGTGDLVTRWSPSNHVRLSGSPMQVFAGKVNACAILTDRTLQCWGQDLYGQLGRGNTGLVQPVPVPVNLAGSVTQVAIGNHRVCAVLESGTLYCWGYNYQGALGVGDNSDRS
jgi:alpha-tubulin suppressor-like RCC1 family protein